MKYLFTIVSTFLFLSSFGQGISFEETNFQSALDKAKKENKLVFMDAYTTWCGPCKWMSKNVFTDKQVGDYYNDKFVNVKIDMERGEGVDIAKKYEVAAYPSLLYINGDGEVMHRSIGSRPALDFLDLGKAANDPDRQYTTMKKRFDSGERSADFLKMYTDVLTSSGMKDFDDVAQLYMDTQKDWTTEENMNFIFDYSEASLDSRLFKYTVDNRDAFIKLVGKERFDQKVKYAADRDRSKAGIARDDVDKLKEHYAKYVSLEEAYNMSMMSYFNQLMYSPDPVGQEKFIAEIQLFLADTPDLGSRYYNKVAWQVYEISNDKMVLAKAADWAQISIDGKKDSYNTDTMAALLYKLGKMDKARTFALESIELAKEEGNDYSATQDLLNKIDLKN